LFLSPSVALGIPGPESRTGLQARVCGWLRGCRPLRRSAALRAITCHDPVGDGWTRRRARRPDRTRSTMKIARWGAAVGAGVALALAGALPAAAEENFRPYAD